MAFYLADPRHRPAWLRTDRLLGEHGIHQDTAATRRTFEERMETRRREEGDPRQWQGLRRGWCLGSEAFRDQLLERMRGQLAPNHPACSAAKANAPTPRKSSSRNCNKPAGRKAN